MFSKSKKSKVDFILDYMRPKRSPFKLIRVGGSEDGAYLIPDDLKGVSACFSPGVNNFKWFEDELLSKWDIRSHMCDKSSDLDQFETPLIEGKQTFIKKWLDVANDSDSITLDDWVQQFESNSDDLLLQMDIEGAEYRNILDAGNSTLSRFRTVVLELHHLGQLNNERQVNDKFFPFFKKLAKNFTCVHAHPNNCCGEVALTDKGLKIPHVLELTLLRKDRYLRSFRRIKPQIPHPLDIQWNQSANPPLFFDDSWIKTGKFKDLEFKRTQIESEYYKSQYSKFNLSTKEQKQSYEMLSSLLNSQTAPVSSESVTANSCKNVIELAEGKNYFCSSSVPIRAKTGKVKAAKDFFFHTRLGVNQFITIDLEEDFLITTVEIYNRRDAGHQRAYPIIAVVHEASDKLQGITQCFPYNESFLLGEGFQASVEFSNAQGRFVTIVSPYKTVLHFSDIKVLGIKPD